MTATCVPFISTPAGACLTYDNWSELGIATVAYDLAQLLMKPGLAYLQQMTDLKAYLGWHKQLVLDASRLVLNNKDQFVIKSIYDGAQCVLSLDDFWVLLNNLKADVVLLPKDINNIPPMPLGKSQLLAFLLCNTPEECGSSEYVFTEKGLQFELDGHKYYVSDQPAYDAYHGVIYLSDGPQSILESIFTYHFEPISMNCDCPTCKQQFTCAYLQHLYQHTPLLCQRLLGMHNVYTSSLAKFTSS